jgi:hypothetical protein
MYAAAVLLGLQAACLARCKKKDCDGRPECRVLHCSCSKGLTGLQLHCCTMIQLASLEHCAAAAAGTCADMLYATSQQEQHLLHGLHITECCSTRGPKLHSIPYAHAAPAADIRAAFVIYCLPQACALLATAITNANPHMYLYGAFLLWHVSSCVRSCS